MKGQVTVQTFIIIILLIIMFIVLGPLMYGAINTAIDLGSLTTAELALSAIIVPALAIAIISIPFNRNALAMFRKNRGRFF